MSNDERYWFVGVDWASSKHDVSLTDADGIVVGRRVFEHSGQGLAALADWLVGETGAEPAKINVAIEVPHGPVVEMLLERGFAVFSINPKQLDRFRDRFSPSGAKDDRRDGDVLASAVRTDRHAFRRLEPADPIQIELREWSRMAEEHKRDLVRFTNRLTEQLRRYFPAFLELGGDSDAAWKLALLELAPTPELAARLTPAKVARLLKEHRVRMLAAGEAVAILRRPALVVSAATVATSSAHVRALLQSIRLAIEQRNAAERQLDRLVARLSEPEETGPGQTKQRDAAILLSSPGLGRGVLTTLLAEAPQAVRERDDQMLRRQAGLAPVTRQSGKTRLVARRHACSRRLRDAMHHWASRAIALDPPSRARYDALRARGYTWGCALRAVADRLLYVVCTMLNHGTLWDPERAKCPPKTA